MVDLLSVNKAELSLTAIFYSLIFCLHQWHILQLLQNPRTVIGLFLLSVSGQTHEVYRLCVIAATSESRKFENSICHYLTIRKRPFFSISQ